MAHRLAEWIVAFNQAEPVDASALVLLAIAWLLIVGCGVVAWWKGGTGRAEDPDWYREGNVR